MSTWTLIQVVFDIFAALGFFVVVMRLNRAPKDDPRLSRGLQLLQSKISVLEDLSDRTEQQVGQLAAILDQKVKEVQAKVLLADQHVNEIRISMERSLEVAKIFQDKIPHEEIIERQNTIKYVHAARLAHHGMSAGEIATKVDLPKGEIEFIAKVNRERLMFNEESLPEWAKSETPIAAQVEPGGYDTKALSAHGETNLSHLSFQEPAQSLEAQTHRSQAELELGEHQRLVDNLSRLQSEMKTLDLQLAREASVKNFSSAFEPPQIESESLQRLGEEFRRACEDANRVDDRSNLLPPLGQLTSLIPQIFGDFSQAPSDLAAQPQSHGEETHLPPANPTAPTEFPLRDPVLAKAIAQSKVQAALAKANPGPVAAPAKPVSQELINARAMASEPVIRKVQFPKIESTGI